MGRQYNHRFVQSTEMSIKVYSEDKVREVHNVKKFKEKYHLIQAAGGVVTDNKGRVLLIFRRNKWDLPKGKVEDNEPIELCAEREVKEETGLKELLLRNPLLITYHTYKEKGESILKETHWFLLDAPPNQEFQPQTEEDIIKVEWVEKERLSEYKNNTYLLIKEVLASAGY